MRAVNLIPGESRRGGVSPSLGQFGLAHAVLGLLAVALGLVTVYVLTANTVSSRTSQLATLTQQVSQVQTEVTRLQSYAQFEQLAQQRAATVRQIAGSRFDWHQALSDLSKVVPSDTSLQALSATVSTTSASGASASSGSGTVRSAINAPAFQLKGCTHTQDQVAQLMSRLRVINGVTRVTLEDSSKGGSTSGTGVSGSGASGGGCPTNGPTFDMVVFFQPSPTAAGSAAGQTVSTTGVTK